MEILYNYKNYLKENNSFIKPDPAGLKNAIKDVSYSDFNALINDKVNEAKKDAYDIIINFLKKDLIGRTISIMDNNDRQKIIEVKYIIFKNNKIFFIDSNKKEVQYNHYNNIYMIDDFLKFFDKNLIKEDIEFTGKLMNSSKTTTIKGKVTKIGIIHGNYRDSIVVEIENGEIYLFDHKIPIKTSKNIPHWETEVVNVKVYVKEIENILKENVIKAKTDAYENIVNILKKDLNGKIISFYEITGAQRILEVSDIIIDKGKKDDLNIFLLGDNKKCSFDLNKYVKDIGKFLEFFEEYFLNNFLMFYGKSSRGVKEIKMNEIIKKIGIIHTPNEDSIIVESDDKKTYLLNHSKPIKILDIKLKELDPFGEENWD